VAVIIKKENNKPVYNTLHLSEAEKIRARKLDEALAKATPEIEKEWLGKRMSKKEGRKIDIAVVYKIGRKLSEIIDNKKLVSPNERRWVLKAIRGMYLKNPIFTKRGETRDDLEYFYKASKYPFEFLKSISWDGWRRLLDSPSIRQDERFENWLQKKAEGSGLLKRGFIRPFTKNLYSLVKNKDTTVLSDQELFEIYESAWRAASNEK
jgi:predicted transcriptional regulator